MKNGKLLVIVGPTASGKSDLAIRLALRLRSRQAVKKRGVTKAEIISADSRQVYRGMDIGTGKITPKEMKGIPHHLLDVVSPKTDFNVAKFVKLARKKIKEIVGRGRVPIIVGGTGFWIDALIYDWPIPKVGADKKLRARLDKKTARQLYAHLKKLDPVRAKTIEPNNKRRLIRALEIVTHQKSKAPKFNMLAFYDGRPRMQYLKIGDKNLKIIIVGLCPPQKELEKRIYKRLIKRLEAGMVREVKKLHNSGVSWKRLDEFGLEYRFVSRHLRGKLAYDEMTDQTYRAIRKYARRQMRWFKRNKNIRWFGNAKTAQKELCNLLRNKLHN